MNTKSVAFKNQYGEMLSGRLELPEIKEPKAFAVFAHCFTCGKAVSAAVRISRALAEAGIATLRFDFTGLDESEGDFGGEGFSANVRDLVSAAEFLESNYSAPQLFIGHSLGGTAAILAAGMLDSVRAVCTIGAPSEASHALALFKDDIQEVRQQGKGRVSLAGREFDITREFLDDFESVRMKEKLKNLKRALLIMHSPLDKIVGIEHAARLFEASMHPKSFVSLDDADHMLGNSADAAYAARTIAAWASRYIDTGNTDDAETMAPGLTVATIGRSHYETRLASGQHIYTADEPEELGGSNLGPTPYDLLLAALGSCTAITLRMYADRKEWPLESVQVRLRHKKVHANDCDECESVSGKVDWIERELVFEGDLTDEQRQRLTEIADKCPVHRTLHSEVHVNTTLVVD